MPGRGAVPCAGDLEGHEHGHHSVGRGQLERSLEKCHREIGRVPVGPALTSPPPVSGAELLPGGARDDLRSEPRRISEDDVKPATSEYIGKSALIVEPGD